MVRAGREGLRWHAGESRRPPHVRIRRAALGVVRGLFCAGWLRLGRRGRAVAGVAIGVIARVGALGGAPQSIVVGGVEQRVGSDALVELDVAPHLVEAVDDHAVLLGHQGHAHQHALLCLGVELGPQVVGHVAVAEASPHAHQLEVGPVPCVQLPRGYLGVSRRGKVAQHRRVRDCVPPELAGRLGVAEHRPRLLHDRAVGPLRDSVGLGAVPHRRLVLDAQLGPLVDQLIGDELAAPVGADVANALAGARRLGLDNVVQHVGRAVLGRDRLDPGVARCLVDDDEVEALPVDRDFGEGAGQVHVQALEPLGTPWGVAHARLALLPSGEAVAAHVVAAGRVEVAGGGVDSVGDAWNARAVLEAEMPQAAVPQERVVVRGGCERAAGDHVNRPASVELEDAAALGRAQHDPVLVGDADPRAVDVALGAARRHRAQGDERLLELRHQ